MSLAHREPLLRHTVQHLLHATHTVLHDHIRVVLRKPQPSPDPTPGRACPQGQLGRRSWKVVVRDQGQLGQERSEVALSFRPVGVGCRGEAVGTDGPGSSLNSPSLAVSPPKAVLRHGQRGATCWEPYYCSSESVTGTCGRTLTPQRDLESTRATHSGERKPIPLNKGPRPRTVLHSRVIPSGLSRQGPKARGRRCACHGAPKHEVIQTRAGKCLLSRPSTPIWCMEGRGDPS